MKVVTIIGARPQCIKAASLSRAVEAYNQETSGSPIKEVLVHTGQHYDHNMSQVFFEELAIREPDHNLGVGSGTHGKMTAAILEGVEGVLMKEGPDCVLVYGDTNSTLAGALAAAKLHIPVAHVEAGLRSFNRQMPEEINRVLTDHVSTFLFCPTDAAVENLKKEGIAEGIFKVGDVMFDSFLFNKKLADEKSTVLSDLGLEPKSYCLGTVHREENTMSGKRVAALFDAFNRIATEDVPFILPLHPRTARVLSEIGGSYPRGSNVRILEPVSYLDMVLLETHAKVIFTDSGGVQKEAYFAGTPCVTLRQETEWVELVDRGVNIVAGSHPQRIIRAHENIKEKVMDVDPNLYGDGQASKKIVQTLLLEVSGG